jgi:hypothetical protein
MSNNLNSFFYNFGKFVRVISKPFLIYLFFIILIVLFPPIENTNNYFMGWSFITELGAAWRINMVYFLSEIGIVTLVYFAHFLSKKK